MTPKVRKTRVTLSNVAEHAGVALSTASVILSENSPYLRNFSKETVHRVRKTAEKLGYRTNLFAGLSSQYSSVFFAIALHDLHDPLAPDQFRWGFDGDLLGGATEVAREASVHPIVSLAKPHLSDWDIESVSRVIGGGVFGAIVRTPNAALESDLRRHIRDGCPVIVVFPEVLSRWTTNAVDVDNHAMGRAAGKVFAAQNRNRWLAIVDVEDRGSHARRLAGLRAVAREAGCKLEILACPQTLSVAEAYQRIQPKLAEMRPDAVFAPTSKTAEGVLLACRNLGLGIGTDALLVGCDCSLWNTVLTPKVTSLEASWRHAGQVAMRKLLDMRISGICRCPRSLLEPIWVTGETCPVRGR